MKRCLCIALILLATGCEYWGRRPVNDVRPVNPDNPVWIWTNGGVEQWHHVIVTPDSVSGAPWGLNLPKGYSCGVCRRSIARTQVDSMKVGYRTWVEKSFDVVASIALILGYLYSK